MVTEIIQERRSRSKSNRISKGVRRDGEPSRLPWKKILNLFNKSKANKRYEGLVLCKVHHIRHHWKRFYGLITVIINKTRMGRRKPVGITRAKGLRLYFALDYVYVFKTRTAKHKKTWSISYFHDEFVHVVQCYSIKCKKRNHKYFVSRTKLLTSGDMELSPGPVTQGNNPNNLN